VAALVFTIFVNQEMCAYSDLSVRLLDVLVSRFPRGQRGRRKPFPLHLGLGFRIFETTIAPVAWPAERPDEDCLSHVELRSSIQTRQRDPPASYGCGLFNMTHPRRLTLEQVAEELHTTPRWLREWLRTHSVDQHGEPFYTPVGRDKIFRQTDLDRIELTLREEVKCRSHSGRRGKAKRRISKSEASTSDALLKRAAELTGDPSLLSNSSASRGASKRTGSIQRPNLSLIQGSRHS
jgi:hypothetical protein